MRETHKIIGRQREQFELHRVFALTREGKGGIVLLAGEAGIGKTLLAEENLAQSGLRVFTGRVTEKTTPSYGPITAVFRDYLRQMPKDPLDCGSLTVSCVSAPGVGRAPEAGRSPNPSRNH